MLPTTFRKVVFACLLTAPLLLAHCGGNGGSEDSQNQNENIDGDNDGFTTAQGDCDDMNAGVNPGETELCGNGIDENCDDQDLNCAPDPDADADGFTADEGDCDDKNADMNPAAEELCGNGVDEDCNGNDPICPEIDQDGDTFKISEGDCDDTDASVYPGAYDLIGDDTDSDCDSLGNADDERITTVAGTGVSGHTSTGPGVTSPISLPAGIDTDNQGNVYFGDLSAYVYKLGTDGTLTTIAGNGQNTTNGDGNAATAAAISQPSDVAVDSLGNVYILTANSLVRKVNAKGIISTVAGGGTSAQENIAATLAGFYATGIAVDAQGDLYIVDSNSHRIRKVTVNDGFINTVAGGNGAGYAGDNGPALQAQLNFPYDVAIAPDGTLYISDSVNNAIRKVAPDKTISTLAGGPGNTIFSFITSIDFDAVGGVVYTTDTGTNQVLGLASDGTVTAIAGTGTAGYSGDAGPAVNAQLKLEDVSTGGGTGYFGGVGVDSYGNVYIGDTFNHRIRRINP